MSFRENLPIKNKTYVSCFKFISTKATRSNIVFNIYNGPVLLSRRTIRSQLRASITNPTAPDLTRPARRRRRLYDAKDLSTAFVQRRPPHVRFNHDRGSFTVCGYPRLFRLTGLNPRMTGH